MNRKRKLAKSGFTLVEVLLAMTITGMILAASTGSLVFLAKSTKGIGNYQEMNMDSRFALEDFGSDARMTMEVITAGASILSLDVYNSTGGVSRIIYRFDQDAAALLRTVGGATEVVLEDVVSLNFIYYDLHGNPTTNVLSVKEVQIRTEMQRSVLRVTNTNEIISARFMMRNRSVSS